VGIERKPGAGFLRRDGRAGVTPLSVSTSSKYAEGSGVLVEAPARRAKR